MVVVVVEYSVDSEDLLISSAVVAVDQTKHLDSHNFDKNSVSVAVVVEFAVVAVVGVLEAEEVDHQLD